MPGELTGSGKFESWGENIVLDEDSLRARFGNYFHRPIETNIVVDKSGVLNKGRREPQLTEKQQRLLALIMSKHQFLTTIDMGDNKVSVPISRENVIDLIGKMVSSAKRNKEVDYSILADELQVLTRGAIEEM